MNNAIVISVNPRNFITNYQLRDCGKVTKRFANLVDEIISELGLKAAFRCETLGYDDVSLIINKDELSLVQVKALARIIDSLMTKPMADSEFKTIVEEYEKDFDGTISMPVGLIQFQEEQ